MPSAIPENPGGRLAPPESRRDAIFALEPRTFSGFLVAVAAVIIIAVLSYDSVRQTAATSQDLARTVEALAQVQAILSTLKDAETGQRGYLLTGRETYLEPFESATQALPLALSAARERMAEDPAQAQRLATLTVLANEKLQELSKTVELRRAGQSEAALAVVQSDHGKTLMDRIRSLGEEMQNEERQRVVYKSRDWRSAATFSFAVTSGGSLVLLFLIGVAAAMASRDFKARNKESWLRAGQLGLGGVMQGDLPLERLADNVVRYLAQYLDAQAGAVFIAEGNAYRRVGAYALPPGDDTLIRPGDGLAGQAVKNKEPLHVRGVPGNYLPIASGTGASQSAELLIAPATIDGRAYGVVELGFFGKVDAAKPELLHRIAEPLAAAIRASKDRTRLEELLQETQRAGARSCRRGRRSCASTTRSWRSSRGRCASRARSSSRSRRSSSRSTPSSRNRRRSSSIRRMRCQQSHAILTAKSDELQRANEYKSEFLANMSHELRTPLNSTLILAKLLADNKDGNLNETQVKYAQTISSAGKDLLTLINDVLDLSRIEAGKIDVAAEPVRLASVIDSLEKMIQPQALAKAAAIRGDHRSRDAGRNRHRSPAAQPDPEEPAVQCVEVHPARRDRAAHLPQRACHRVVRGPRHRRRHRAPPARGHFRGLPPGRREHSSQVRRHRARTVHFAGSGAIAGRHDIGAKRAGQGQYLHADSAARYSAAIRPPAAGTPAGGHFPPPGSATEAPAGHPRAARPHAAAIPSALAAASIADDRDQLTPGVRLILVVEDDVPFALILRDLAHEMEFQTVVVHSAGDALIAAERYRPSAILLDINLPDFSGLGVLDQLKRNPQNAAHTGARRLGRGLQARGARARCRRLRAQARQARGAGGSAATHRGQAVAKPAPRAHRRGRSAAARKPATAPRQRRRADHGRGERRRGAQASSPRRRSTAWCSISTCPT